MLLGFKVMASPQSFSASAQRSSLIAAKARFEWSTARNSAVTSGQPPGPSESSMHRENQAIASSNFPWEKSRFPWFLPSSSPSTVAATDPSGSDDAAVGAVRGGGANAGA